MSIRVYYTCPKCEDEIPVEVVIGEESDLPSECPNCSAAIPDEAHAEMETRAIESAADRAEDFYDQ